MSRFLFGHPCCRPIWGIPMDEANQQLKMYLEVYLFAMHKRKKPK
jgi:hypothetical protein